MNQLRVGRAGVEASHQVIQAGLGLFANECAPPPRIRRTPVAQSKGGEDGAEGETIGSLIGCFPATLFGGHITRLAQDGASQGVLIGVTGRLALIGVTRQLPLPARIFEELLLAHYVGKVLLARLTFI